MNFLQQGLDIGLARLYHTGHAAALTLTPVSAIDSNQESERLKGLHQLPGLAEASPTRRWAVTGLAWIWEETKATPKSASMAQYLRSDRVLSRRQRLEILNSLPGLWGSTRVHQDFQSSSDHTRLLVLHPWSVNPLQLYEIPEQRPGDHELSLVSRRDRQPHLQLLEFHRHYHAALVLPKSLEDSYIECDQCRKAVHVNEMDQPCLFHPGLSGLSFNYVPFANCPGRRSNGER